MTIVVFSIIAIVATTASFFLGGKDLFASEFNIGIADPEVRAWYAKRDESRMMLEAKREQDLQDLKAARLMTGPDLFPQVASPPQTAILIEGPGVYKGLPYQIAKVRVESSGEEVFAAVAGPDKMKPGDQVHMFMDKKFISDFYFCLKQGETPKGIGWKKVFGEEQDEEV